MDAHDLAHALDCLQRVNPRAPVLTTPPAVGTPTSWPRCSVLIAWLKISALLKLLAPDRLMLLLVFTTPLTVMLPVAELMTNGESSGKTIEYVTTAWAGVCSGFGSNAVMFATWKPRAENSGTLTAGSEVGFKYMRQPRS